MKLRSLKTLILSGLALVATAFAFAPTSAEAGHQTRSAGRCGSCGSAIYQQLVFTGSRDRCGNPVFQWVSVGHSCSSHSNHNHGSQSGYQSSRGSSYGSSYSSRSSGYSGFSGGITIRRFSGSSNGSSCRN